jgi:hypothetical protein
MRSVAARVHTARWVLMTVVQGAGGVVFGVLESSGMLPTG